VFATGLMRNDGTHHKPHYLVMPPQIHHSMWCICEVLQLVDLLWIFAVYRKKNADCRGLLRGGAESQ
jgi:hypothetical protein